jgi:hypothetical protein
MTAKKIAKKVNYKLEDFFTKSLAEKSTKMALMYDGNDTGCHLMVKGIDAKSVQRSRVVAQIAYADAADVADKIADKVEKEEYSRAEKERIEICLATDLVSGWSFGELDGKKEVVNLLCENQGLAFAVIAHATTPGNYLTKK